MFAASGEFNAEATERTQVRPKGGSSWSVLDLALGSRIDYLRAAAAAADPAKGRLQHRGKLRGPPRSTVTH